MVPRRLKLLFLSQFPPSPPAFGAQRRIQGLMATLARRHDVAAISLISPDLDAGAAEAAMLKYCSEVHLVPAPAWQGVKKRLAQLRSLASPRSFERRFYDLPQLRAALHQCLTRRGYDIVNVELPFLALQRLRQAPPGQPTPRLVLDEHNIEFDLARQQASKELGLARRLHNSSNWPKLRHEEVLAWRRFDAVAFCSPEDERRAHELVPALRSAVVPNSVDVDDFKPRPGDPPPDGRTVMFFGAINYFPNVDGLMYLLREIWPILEKSHPQARLKIVGQHPTPEVLAFRGPRVEVTGRVDDVRPHLAGAAVCIAPLRIGGGTRFKILEAMAMAKPVVATSLGAEGIEYEAGRHLLIGDDPPSFAAAVGRVLDDGALAARLSRAGRALVEERYSWAAAAERLERLYAEVLESPGRAGANQ
ncbi:MAG TPA: glycosyltransferase [Myxococcales bacterium]|nr:glycosyltransferase [Myxococcales bacterium]